jgi:hypothetical protein
MQLQPTTLGLMRDSKWVTGFGAAGVIALR